MLDARPDRLDDARALVPGDHGHRPRPVAVDDVQVGVAHPARAVPDQRLAGARRIELDGLDGERRARLGDDGGPGLHAASVGAAWDISGGARPECRCRLVGNTRFNGVAEEWGVMASTRTKAGLSAVDLETLRAAVDAGRKPKVTFTAAAGQIAGKTGQVLRLEDPHASEEWVVVRFGKDELPFAPSDLQFPPKPAPVKVAAQRVETIEPPQWTPAAPPMPENA